MSTCGFVQGARQFRARSLSKRNRQEEYLSGDRSLPTSAETRCRPECRTTAPTNKAFPPVLVLPNIRNSTNRRHAKFPSEVSLRALRKSEIGRASCRERV